MCTLAFVLHLWAVVVTCVFEVLVLKFSWFRAVLVVLMVLVMGVACGGDDEAEPTRDVVMSTFTPRPSGETPTAESTDVAASPTAAATTPSGPREPTPTPGPNEIRPPELVLVTPDGRSVGLVAANAWYDPETQTFSGFEFSGQVILATDPIEWPADSEASFEVQQTSPFPAGSTDIAFYRYDGNIATPLNPQGQVIGTDPAYVRQEDPVAELQLDGEPLVLANPVPAGKYIVDVTVHWPIPAEAAQRAPEEATTEYVFVVVVP
jgi:hypothetical protein